VHGGLRAAGTHEAETNVPEEQQERNLAGCGGGIFGVWLGGEAFWACEMDVVGRRSGLPLWSWNLLGVVGQVLEVT
jgi:hypothetical protein